MIPFLFTPVDVRPVFRPLDASLISLLQSLGPEWNRPTVARLWRLHRLTSDPVNDYYESLDLYSEAVFAVSWAGETTSLVAVMA